VSAADERFNRIYETQYLAVLAYCARRVNHSEVEDVANEVFVTLWRRIDSFDEMLPLPWLYRVAYGVIRNRWRTVGRTARLRARLSGLAPDFAESPDDVVMRREQDRLVLAALYSLRPADREVLRLLMWEELAVPEIAAAVGCSVSAAAQRLHRAKQRLARALSPQSTATSTSPQSADQGGTR
jgi:RNA polymerase sigma-70 factor, ECF subfamily